MTEMMTLDPADQAAAGSDLSADLGLLVVRPGIVFSIPTAQRYYWTEGWQAGEQETLQAFKDEQGIRFANGTAFTEWLNDDDDHSNGD